MEQLHADITTIFMVISLCLLPAVAICLTFLWLSLQKKVYECEIKILNLSYEIRSLKAETIFFKDRNFTK